MRPKAILRHKRLGRYKLPENIYAEKDEGYDGHLRWNSDSKAEIVTMAVFREAVLEKDQESVNFTLESMGAGATEAQLEHITKLLLKGEPESTKEALLTAVVIGSRPLCEFILSLFVDYPHEERSGCSFSDAFSPHLTPLVLACINNNFALVECLLLRGHSITPPHHKNCKCELCLRQPYSALTSIQKIDILRALCSDAYLWLGTDDPFAAACALSKDLERFILEDNMEFTEWYRALQQAVQHFATRLANQNWSEQELDLFLAHKCYGLRSYCEIPYPRVQLALESGMKDLIACTNVQRAMDEIWWRGWGNFGVNFARDTYRILRHGVFFPILSLIYIFSNGFFASSFDVPLARYISNLASYLTFLASLFAVRWFRGQTSEALIALRILLEAYMYFYALGMLAERYLAFSRQGFRSYFQFWWRWFDFLLLGCFLLAMHIWICRLFVPYDRHLFYERRTHVEPMDYGLVYDVYLATGCILAIWRIFYYCQLNKTVGASIISVGRCVGHVTTYLLIMAVITVAFAVGLNMLIQPYESIDANKNNSFFSVSSSIRNLYWALFGYFDLNTLALAVGNAGPEYAEQDHYLTKMAAELLTAIFHAILVITLLNLMVSLLTKKADEVLDNEELEFKYTRVVIYSEFLHWSTAVPPPFNLLLMIKELILRLCTKKHIKCWPEIFIDRSVIERRDAECEAYSSLMQQAFLRFRSSKEYHYKSVFRTDYTSKDRPTFSAPKVAFMSGLAAADDPTDDTSVSQHASNSGSQHVEEPQLSEISNRPRERQQGSSGSEKTMVIRLEPSSEPTSNPDTSREQGSVPQNTQPSVSTARDGTPRANLEAKGSTVTAKLLKAAVEIQMKTPTNKDTTKTPKADAKTPMAPTQKGSNPSIGKKEPRMAATQKGSNPSIQKKKKKPTRRSRQKNRTTNKKKVEKIMKKKIERPKETGRQVHM